MRLGFLTTSYPRYPDDPAGNFVAGLAAWLAGSGDLVEVIAPHPARGDGSTHALQVRSVRYARRPQLCYGAGAPDNLRRPTAWLQVPNFALCFSAECRRRASGWDALVSHWLIPCGLVGALAGRGRPHLAVAHSSDVHLLARLPALGAASLALLARRRTALVLTSSALRLALRRIAFDARARRLVESAAVLRMGIRELAATPTGSRQRRRAELGVGDNEMVVLFLGRLVPVKGVDLLIESCAGLPLRLLVIGAGPERASLQRRAAQLGVAADFLGEQIGEAKAAWLAAADLLVLPSRVLPDGRTESAPLVLLEAMAAGLPVLATRVGGNSELIRHGENGLLAPPGAAAPLRGAILALLGDAGLRARLAEAGRRTAAEHSWSRIGPRFRELLQSLPGASVR